MRTRTEPQGVIALVTGRAAALVTVLAMLTGCTLFGGGAWLEYTRSGGLAGATDSLSVTEQGKVTVKHSGGKTTTQQLSAADLAKLRDAVAAADLKSLKANYGNPAARDAYQYKLGSAGKTVQWVDGTTPESLVALQDLLDKWING